MFPVPDTVGIATHLRSSALLWLLASCFVLCIDADFPRNIPMYIRTLEMATAVSAQQYQHSRGFPLFDERLQDETDEGMNQVK